MNDVVILWFRQDLRIHDNPALVAAVNTGQVLPVYILDDVNAGNASMGAASRVWLHESLKSLNRSLSGRLKLFAGDAARIIPQLCDASGASAVFWNRCYEPWRIPRDRAIKQALTGRGLESRSYNASLLWEPWTILKKDNTPYKVFTPYYQNGCLAASLPRQVEVAAGNIEFYDRAVESECELAELGLLPEHSWHRSILENQKVGEDAAFEKLERFIEQNLSEYRQGRDFPSSGATSSLSTHLHFGEISPHQIWWRLQREGSNGEAENINHFKRELAWREFSYYQLYHWPHLPDTPFSPAYQNFRWKSDKAALQAWQQGETGFPIIDAGMRELWQTGYMHNRVRMIVASFLVKNLLIDWREGASWFWDCLLDADLASNSASWQWCAGCGADAAPYFRVFNPVLQSQKFDPDGEYIGRFCPELGQLPLKYQHQPWLATQSIDYPQPMVDLKVTRLRAIEWYKSQLRQSD